jgi:hypothetical protein
MKPRLFKYLPLLFTVTLLVTACKKENDDSQKLNADAEVATHYDDESLVSDETDALATEINSLIESDPVMGGSNSVLEEVICDATVAADFESDPMTVTVTFNGANCGPKRTRTGVLILSMAKGTQWKNAGAQITATYENLKITRKSDGKSITLNGSHSYINFSGGLLHELPTAGEIIHKLLSDGLTVKFDDGEVRTWNVARKKVFTYNDGVVVNVYGIHQDGDQTNIAEWGTNRFGDAFTTSISSALVIKQSCNLRVTAGEVKHKTAEFEATATFGLDATGNPTDCPGTANYFLRFGWKRLSNGNSFNILLPY